MGKLRSCKAREGTDPASFFPVPLRWPSPPRPTRPSLQAPSVGHALQLSAPGAPALMGPSWIPGEPLQGPRPSSRGPGGPHAPAQVWPSRTEPRGPPAAGRSSCGTSSWSCCRGRHSAMSSPGGRESPGNSSSRTRTRWPPLGPQEVQATDELPQAEPGPQVTGAARGLGRAEVTGTGCGFLGALWFPLLSPETCTWARSDACACHRNSGWQPCWPGEPGGAHVGRPCPPAGRPCALALWAPQILLQ